MSDLMSIFNIAKRGLSTQQKAIGVTSHNIANANTEGYSRQRAVIETTRPFGMPSMNSYIGPGQIGTGSQVQAIQRVRDEFLDYQVRNETSTLGKYEARDKFLSEIENIFNEPSDTGLSTLLGKFFDSWQQLSKQPQSSNARTVVAQQAAALADELNHSYNQLQKLKDNTQSMIKQTVFDTNNILNQIDQLNQQIIGVTVAGQAPNDLMDRRDLLVDKLSKIMNIKIEKREFNSIDISPEEIDGVPSKGQKLLVRKEPNYDVSRFSYINGIEEVDQGSGLYTLKVSYLKGANQNIPGNPIEIKNIPQNQLSEVKRYIDECGVIWAEENDNSKINGTAYSDKEIIDFTAISTGSFKENEQNKLKSKMGLFMPNRGELNGYMSVQEDVDKYVDQMNKLAKAIAFSVNAVHSGMEDPSNINILPNGASTQDKDYMPFFVNNDIASSKYVNDKIPLGDLDDILNGESGITAGNISVNKQILSDVMEIKTRKDDDQFKYSKDNDINGETDGSRALAIAQLRDKLFKIQNITDDTDRSTFINIFTGDGINGQLLDDGNGVPTVQSNINGMKVDNYFKDVIDELGVQEQEAKRIVTNQESLLAGFQESKESVSGVSLDEEMANMIQFQHAYQANAKIVSVVDELLDVVVNGLKK